MEELCGSHEDLLRTDQIKVRDNGLIVAMMLESLTRHYFTRTVGPNPRIYGIAPVEVQVNVVQGVLVNITKVDFQLLFVGLNYGMRNLHVLGAILRWNGYWWLAVELAVPGCRGRENDTGHKPGRWNFYEEN